MPDEALKLIKSITFEEKPAALQLFTARVYMANEQLQESINILNKIDLAKIRGEIVKSELAKAYMKTGEMGLYY